MNVDPEQLQAWLEKAVEVGVPYALNVVWVLVIFFVGKWFANRFAQLTRKGLERAKVDPILSRFASNMVRYAVIVFTLLACLNIFGVETTSFVAVLGAAGLAVGLALQGTLSNFAAGIMLLLFRPFKLGDVVQAAGVTGTVNQLQIFSTVLITPDNISIVVPNSQIYGAIIQNFTALDHRRVTVDVGVAYDADIDKTKQLLIDAVKNLPNVETSKPVDAYLVGLGASSVDFQVRVFCEPANWGTVREAVTRAVKIALDHANVGIPYPQLDLHVVSNGTALATI